MKLLQQVEARNREWRDEEMRRQDAFEDRIERRYRVNLIMQALVAVVAVVGTLIAAKLLPFFNF